MTVKELIKILEDLDPDARVFVVSQENWPFENDLWGVAVREDMHERDDDDGDHTARNYERGTAANDVFLVEGQQLRYGSKSAWRAARR